MSIHGVRRNASCGVARIGDPKDPDDRVLPRDRRSRRVSIVKADSSESIRAQHVATLPIASRSVSASNEGRSQRRSRDASRCISRCCGPLWSRARGWNLRGNDELLKSSGSGIAAPFLLFSSTSSGTPLGTRDIVAVHWAAAKRTMHFASNYRRSVTRRFIYRYDN